MIADAAPRGNPETDHGEQPPELPPPRHREQLLLGLDLSAYRQRTLLAALLREIARWAPRPCYASQATLARMYQVSPRTAKRALCILTRELGVVLAERRGRTMPDGRHASTNHYTVCWPALERMVAAGDRPRGQPGVPLGQGTDSGGQGTDRPGLGDSCAGGRGQIGPAKGTARCPPILRELTQPTTDVVVEVGEVLAQAAEAVRLARSRGLSDADIRERYRQWRDLPEHQRQPGRLYRWLAVAGSYSAPVAEPEQSPLRGDAMPRAEVAAERIRYGCYRAGRRAGATDEAIELAIQRRLEAMTA